MFFFFYSRGDHRDLHSFPTRRSSDLADERLGGRRQDAAVRRLREGPVRRGDDVAADLHLGRQRDRKSTRLNSSHVRISYAVFCLKKKKEAKYRRRTFH